MQQIQLTKYFKKIQLKNKCNIGDAAGYLGWRSMQSAFLGTTIDSVFEVVILVPIKPIYEKLRNRFGMKFSKGYYESFIGDVDKQKRVLGLHAPQGNCITDVLKLVVPCCKKLILTGICGSLTDKVQLGELVCPSCIIDEQSSKKKYLFTHNNRKQKTVCQVSGLIQKKYVYQQLKENHVEYVDMESYYCAEKCHEFGIDMIVAEFVSDFPLSQPFYSITKRPKLDYNFLYKVINESFL